MTEQNPRGVLMVRPTGFAVNAETAADNAFQSAGATGDREAALAEFDAMVRLLRAAGVFVRVFDQAREDTPDAVFPNNWLSTHADGRIVTYPMYAPSRRKERRADITDWLLGEAGYSDSIDLSGWEAQGAALEGTGAVVFDHRSRLAYCVRSRRSHPDVLDALCEALGYEAVRFGATDAAGQPIYHTNVMMALGASASFACLDAIPDTQERRMVEGRLEEAGAPLVALTQGQVAEFAANSFEVDGEAGPVLVLSARAWRGLTPPQRKAVADAVDVITPSLPTIEKSGGSARCMMAGLYRTNGAGFAGRRAADQ